MSGLWELLQVYRHNGVATMCEDKTGTWTQREMETKTGVPTALNSLSTLTFALSTWVSFYFSLSTASEIAVAAPLCLYYQRNRENVTVNVVWRLLVPPSCGLFIFATAETSGCWGEILYIHMDSFVHKCMNINRKHAKDSVKLMETDRAIPVTYIISSLISVSSSILSSSFCLRVRDS